MHPHRFTHSRCVFYLTCRVDMLRYFWRLMYNNIYCLYANGGSLSQIAYSFLYVTACQMIFENSKSFHLKDEKGEVNLHTRFQFSCLGSLCGTRFDAIIEEGSSTVRTACIVRDTNFEKNISETVGWVTGTEKDIPKMATRN